MRRGFVIFLVVLIFFVHASAYSVTAPKGYENKTCAVFDTGLEGDALDDFLSNLSVQLLYPLFVTYGRGSSGSDAYNFYCKINYRFNDAGFYYRSDFSDFYFGCGIDNSDRLVLFYTIHSGYGRYYKGSTMSVGVGRVFLDGFGDHFGIDGREFLGWWTEPDGGFRLGVPDGYSYVSFGKEQVFYARWAPRSESGYVTRDLDVSIPRDHSLKAEWKQNHVLICYNPCFPGDMTTTTEFVFNTGGLWGEGGRTEYVLPYGKPLHLLGTLGSDLSLLCLYNNYIEKDYSHKCLVNIGSFGLGISNYDFCGWYTEPGGAGRRVEDGETFWPMSSGEVLELYAYWLPRRAHQQIP